MKLVEMDLSFKDYKHSGVNLITILGKINYESFISISCNLVLNSGRDKFTTGLWYNVLMTTNNFVQMTARNVTKTKPSIKKVETILVVIV